MSRSKSAADINILDAAEKWKQQCLLDGGSLFSEESLWTRENFDQLRIHFVDNPDEGSRSFYEKLAQQLTPAPPEVKRLWAEMTWVLFLIVYRGVLKPETKRDQIRQVWEWSGSVLPDNHWALGEVLAKGVTNPGQAYNSRRWRECCFFITTMISWFSHSSEDRESLLTDPWDFAEWLGTQDYSPPRPQFQHAFLYLLFPDAFEAIMSQSHKEKIVNAFSKKWNENLLTNDGDNVALDQALLKIRERLQDEYPDTRVDFYSSQFKDIWQSSQPPPPPPPQVKETAPLFASYSIANILAEGCFLEREKLKTILQRLRDKKNLILQGPPGTGKTWLAKKLAFAVIGERDEDKIRPVQFHPNLSYEDFVRGWRPSGDGKLGLIDGPFLQMINTAKDDPDPESRYAIIIEEINRGNPAQIFGEMLTLLESDKRNKDEALELSYRRREGERVYIPENLYVIGTMNVADRSIAMVDFALRRRFAFVDLEPIFGSVWRNWVHDQCKIDEDFLSQVEEKMNALNEQIAGDSNLGAQFRVGHSYVTPSAGEIDDSPEWFKQVVETEIGPLLDEYWFDALDPTPIPCAA
ncbi:MAG: AAA family ATPase [Gemmatimonadetes bacterium]|nr:AAA family ATPase [Gemmatimonadota bacterium]